MGGSSARARVPASDESAGFGGERAGREKAKGKLGTGSRRGGRGRVVFSRTGAGGGQGRFGNSAEAVPCKESPPQGGGSPRGGAVAVRGIFAAVDGEGRLGRAE